MSWKVLLLENMIKGNTLEKYLIEHCAPTLAGIKSASLFSCRFFSKEEVDQELKQLNENKNVLVCIYKYLKREEN